jgi:peptide chain release factor 1
MEALIVEVRAGEGGADAKLLVEKQLMIYLRYAKRLELECELLRQEPGQISLRVSGRGAWCAFEHEPGGHRWQRVPPTEKRGRVHSSTVTVAVLREVAAREHSIPSSEVKFEAYRASGPGGQHRNTSDTAIRATHLPTGIQACAETKSQQRNKELALGVLRTRVAQRAEGAARAERNSKRKEQVGSGMRADKIRTVAEQRGRVENHLTGRRIPLKDYERGNLARLL